MPLEAKIFNIYGADVLDVHGHDPVYIKIELKCAVICPHCASSQLRKKDKRQRKVRHEGIGRRRSILVYTSYKYMCKCCGRYFWNNPPFVQSRHRSTEPFRKQVVAEHVDGVSLHRLATRLGLSASTIDRWNKERMYALGREKLSYPCPRVLGIDEHFFTKRDGFATTLCDLGRHRVYDVILGRSEDSLASALKRLEGREQVRVVVMDMSETYRSIAKKWFPKARLVVDRFHVVKLVNLHFLKYWSSVDGTGRKSRGLVSLMRRHSWNMKPEQRAKLDSYLSGFPTLEGAYWLRHHIMKALLRKNQRPKGAMSLGRHLLNLLKRLDDTPMYALAVTLRSWFEEIVGMWRFSKTNGITEGFHTKMEMISRRAFGYRNFENYRLRVRALCA
jgi:transposase